MYDYIVIGAGPAGVQVAYYLQKHSANYLVIEAGENPGTFFETYPRHRTLISINKKFTGSDCVEYNLRHDWNSLLSEENFPLFTSYDQAFFPSADNLLHYLKDFVTDHQLNITFKQRIAKINRTADGFQLISDNGDEFACKRLIISTGVAKPFIPKIDGIELVEQYQDVSVQTEQFENQRVLVIGKGNSAFETADHLIPVTSLLHICSPHPLTMAWKSHYVGDLRAVNNNLLDTYQLKSQNAVLDAEIKTIVKKGNGFLVQFGYAHANDEVESIYYDRIICCTGFRMDRSPFDNNSEPQMTIDSRFPSLTPAFESVNVKDMYFAGTLTQSINYRKTTSGFIHGFRYNAQALVRILMHKYHDLPLQQKRMTADHQCITHAIIERINKTSALWQQHGFMVDVITIDSANDTSQYYQQLPRQYCHQQFSTTDLYFVLALDFGAPIEGDPFNQTRIHKDNVHSAQQSKFLHPIVYLCRHGEELASHHIIEDLEADWTDTKIHIKPLENFIHQYIATPAIA